MSFFLEVREKGIPLQSRSGRVLPTTVKVPEIPL